MTQWGLDTLFNPAKRHMDEEKRRLQSTREEIGDSSGGKRIDLESGKVTIERKAKDEDDEDTSSNVVEANGSEPSAKGERQLTPAQIRAAQRRGRKPR
jgi:hypothetical protein